ncbi:hypothetical protein BDU57DRAFT_543087 [Ampelomyces quisqualis]|uniref:Uncharacterized protein n=1 Tax=Ampelomyces quisqualis TaxID=50730 RepID=A0A6A5Q9V9_AMPQU|nr:hypothetical protein BDU57DRAFT_543087 [Ampelomyces quisqualis]
MLWIVFIERKDYIVTLGDGASSFLERPDPNTERMCILSKQYVVREVADAPIRPRHNNQLLQLVTKVFGILFAVFIFTVVYLSKATTKWSTKSGTTIREADHLAQRAGFNA